jgi:uncharacterized membrane protein
MYLVLENKNQTIFSSVIFNLHKLDNNILAILEVRHPLYSLILQGFVLFRVVILLLIFLYTKRTHKLASQTGICVFHSIRVFYWVLMNAKYCKFEPLNLRLFCYF